MNANEAKREARIAEWTERVRECRSSGQRVKTWCAERGISPATYYRWEREVLGKADEERCRNVKREETENRPVFLELPGRVRQANAVPEAGRMVAEIVRDGSVIRIYAGADVEVIRALCGAASC